MKKIKETGYSSNDIREIGPIKVIQINPGMFISSTETPTHLLEEMIDNSLDEMMSGNANIIAVNINTKNKKIAVLDNGRGIPIDNDVPINISTKLFTGAKFQDDKTVYGCVAGLHGCGLVVVNALSNNYKIEVYQNKKYAIYDFDNAELKVKNIIDFTDNIPFSTKIECCPDPKYFESDNIDIDRIRNRLSTASAELSTGNTFILNVDDKKEIFKITTEENFKMNCFDNNEEHSDIIKFNSKHGKEQFNIMFCWSSGPVITRNLSSINLLPVQDGGTHINLFQEVLKNYFSTKAKKLNFKFNDVDCLTGFRAYYILRLINPSFIGQAKHKLGNKKSELLVFKNDLEIQLENYFKKNPETLNLLLSKFQDYRNKILSSKLKSTGKKRSSTKLTKLRDCSSRTGELFIVEGDSAGTGLIESRNPVRHAILPLSGKIKNIVKAKDILKNKTMNDLFSSLGTGINTDCDISQLRYQDIFTVADADPDGGHIATLTIMAIATVTPAIIESGRLWIVHTPLFAINEKKIFIPLWTDLEVEIARNENRNIIRFKGLGEMMPHQLKTCILDQQTRKISQIKMTKHMKKLIDLFSKPETKRQLLNNELNFD